MKKLLAIILLPFSLNAAELAPNHEFTIAKPYLGPLIPACWRHRTTGPSGTFSFLYPVLDSNGRYEAYRLTSNSSYALWFNQDKGCRIPVVGGATYKYTVRAKCNVVMGAIMERYQATTLLGFKGFSSPTVADSKWHTTAVNVTVPLGTNNISIGPYVAKPGVCNFGKVSLQRAP